MKKDIAQINGHLKRKPLQNNERNDITNPRVPILGKQYLVSLSFILNKHDLESSFFLQNVSLKKGS